MAPKRPYLANGTAPTKRRRLAVKPVEEVVFDDAAREDFLTGFHRRKLARARHAQEIAVKKERRQRNEARRTLREERKKDIERHTEAVNKAIASLEKKQAGEEAWSDSESGDGGWQGIAEPEPVDYEDEYLDEDRHTVVTVEEVDPSRQGLRLIADDLDGSSGSNDESSEEEEEKGAQPPAPAATPVTNCKEERKYPSKKKTDFRYEGRAERKYKKSKERSGRRSKDKRKKPRKP